MTFWYNDPKPPSLFAELRCSDYESSTFSARFDELAIIKGEDGHYHFFGNCLKASDLKKYQADGFRIDDSLIHFVVHGSKYKKKKKGDDGNYVEIEVEPSVIENIIATIVEELGLDAEGTFWKGIIDFGLSAKDKTYLLSGTWKDGTPLTNNETLTIQEDVLNLCDTTAVKLAEVNLSETTSRDSKGRVPYNRVSEGQRMSERFTKALELLGVPSEIKTLIELVRYQLTLSEVDNEIFFRAVTLLEKLM